MGKLRVALIGGYQPDATQIRGGVQAAATYLVKGLAKTDGLELHILAFRPRGWVGPDSYILDGVCIHLLPPYPRFERLRDYKVYQSIINQVLGQIQPAIVHAQEAGSDAYVALRTVFPTLVTAHGIRSEDAKYVRSWSQRLRFTVDSVLTEQPVMRRVKYMIAISHYVVDYFAPLMRPDIHLFYLPNAIDESFFSLGGESEKPVILFAGRVTPLKRVIDLVQAFIQVARQIPRAELHIAGEYTSEPSYTDSIRNWIQQAGLSEQIHMLGELCQEDLLREYRACTVVVLPSAQENTPMVLSQAMAAGKPVVATRVGGVAEMVGQDGERGYLINVGDIDGLATTLIGLLKDPVLCARLGGAGHAFSLENYHLDRVAQRTYEVYQEVVAMECIRHD